MRLAYCVTPVGAHTHASMMGHIRPSATPTDLFDETQRRGSKFRDYAAHAQAIAEQRTNIRSMTGTTQRVPAHPTEPTGTEARPIGEARAIAGTALYCRS